MPRGLVSGVIVVVGLMFVRAPVQNSRSAIFIAAIVSNHRRIDMPYRIAVHETTSIMPVNLFELRAARSLFGSSLPDERAAGLIVPSAPFVVEYIDVAADSGRCSDVKSSATQERV